MIVKYQSQQKNSAAKTLIRSAKDNFDEVSESWFTYSSYYLLKQDNKSQENTKNLKYNQFTIILLLIFKNNLLKKNGTVPFSFRVINH